ncbi:MAG: transporter substrate-binding domain-containing protein [Aliidongia sp.]
MPQRSCLRRQGPAEETVVLNYYDRPPYMVPQPDGGATGLTADPAAALFKRAGVPFRWQLTPALRQLSAIKAGAGRDCGIGWFSDAERAGYAVFIGPIHHDKPAVVLAGPGFAVPPGKEIEQLLAEAKLPVLVKDGLTYGRYVTDLIESARLNTVVVPVEQSQMVDMLAAGRAELMFATREEADLLLAAKPAAARKIRIIELAGDKGGEDRYIMCSRKLDPHIIEMLQAALEG